MTSTSITCRRLHRCINKALQAKPADMTITTHVCRGNFRSTWISSGGYEPVAEKPARATSTTMATSSNTIPTVPAASSRCDFCPKGNKIVVLGLITSKTGRLEPRDDIKKRIEEATKFVALDQLCLSPQCGFASTEEGNVLAEDEQWAKLRMIVETCRTRCGENERSHPPPFRADHVGSPAAPGAAEGCARQARQGEIDCRNAQVGRRPRDREDRQEAGRNRPQARHRWRIPPHLVAFRLLSRLWRRRPVSTDTGIKFHGVETKHEAIRIDGKVKFTGHPHIEHFKFLKAHCRVTPKMTIPAPARSISGKAARW